MPHENLTGADFASARLRLGVTQSDLALTLGISLATLRRYETDTSVPRAISLAVAYLLADADTPPSADAAAALAAYSAATTSLTTLYRLAKQAGARPTAAPRQTAQRMTPQEIALRNVEASDIARKLKSARRRNEQRAEQRPMVASIHAALERMTAQANYTTAELHKALAENERMTDNRHTFVHAYLAHVRQFGPVGRLDPIVTLPDEPMPVGGTDA